MRINILAILILISIFPSSYAQVVNQGGSFDDNQDSNSDIVNDKYITNETVRLLTIGIGSFDDAKIGALKSVSSLSRFKKVSEDYLRLSYHYHPSPKFLNGSTVKASDVKEALADLANQSQESEVIIISILSHGVVEDGEYYLVCTDTDSRNYKQTAVAGSEIRRYLEIMANKGAIVLFFLDTCHAAALFEKTDFSPKGNGAIAYFASSMSNEYAKQIGQRCRFTEALLDIFQNKNNQAFNENGFVTIKSIDYHIKAALGSITTDLQQHPVSKWCTNTEDESFEEIPIIKEKELIPPPSIWQNPSPFVPWAVSPNKGKELDYILIGIEGASLVGMVLFGPILQPHYKNKISNETNVFKRNDYRQKGRNASIGFCVNTGCLLTSYIARTLHVRHQMVIEHKEKQFATLDIQPVMSSEFNGLSLVLNF